MTILALAITYGYALLTVRNLRVRARTQTVMADKLTEVEEFLLMECLYLKRALNSAQESAKYWLEKYEIVVDPSRSSVLFSRELNGIISNAEEWGLVNSSSDSYTGCKCLHVDLLYDLTCAICGAYPVLRTD